MIYAARTNRMGALPYSILMKNSEVLKFDDTPIQTQLDETPHDSDERSLKEKLPIESIRRTMHRLNIKAVMAAAKLAKKSNE